MTWFSYNSSSTPKRTFSHWSSNMKQLLHRNYSHVSGQKDLSKCKVSSTWFSVLSQKSHAKRRSRYESDTRIFRVGQTLTSLPFPRKMPGVLSVCWHTLKICSRLLHDAQHWMKTPSTQVCVMQCTWTCQEGSGALFKKSTPTRPEGEFNHNLDYDAYMIYPRIVEVT